MSYDLEVAVKVVGCDKFKSIAYPEWANPTYNLGTMFRKATGWDFKQGEYYRASEVIDFIKHGVDELENYAENYIQYNASNGWGTVKTAPRVLRSLWECIQEQAREIPMDCLWVRW